MASLIIYFFGLHLPENATPIVEILFNMAILCLVVTVCFINVIWYLIVLNLLQNKNIQEIENKYFLLKKIINYYKKVSLITIIIESIVGFSTLFFLIYVGLSPLFLL